MSSQYPIPDNRPIEQWKVTELKEELKRRKLTTKGLKDDLIKRLGEALRIERENAEQGAKEDADNCFKLESQTVVGETNAEAASVASGPKTTVDAAAAAKNEVDNVVVHVDINDAVGAACEDKLQEEVIMGSNIPKVEGERNIHATTLETSITVIENVVSEGALSDQDAQNFETQEVNGNSNIQLDYEDSKPLLENEDSKLRRENEGLRPRDEDVLLDSSAPNNQVSAVSANLAFQVKSDSISTDSVSINEKIELKDNIITDNVKLELDDVKPEMVEPSSSNVVPVGGESHPMDVEESQEKPPVEENDDSNAANADMSKKNGSVDLGYSEKLNLDRSSGEDSMEEDVMESKQIDSKYNSDEGGDRIEKNEVHVMKDENLVDIVGNDSSTDQKEIHVENKIRPAVLTEKRKLNDQEAAGNTEPLKRQRKWNSESLKVPETQGANLTLTTTPKDTSQPTPLRRNFSRSDSSVSEEAPKERVVPPSQKLPTNSLRIDRFLRPFTLKAVQELLGRTGSVTSFWMDHIKTHCYVTYSSVDEAIETRNAVYNLQWPPNGGRLLVAEFVDALEVKIRVEAPPQSPAAPITPSATATAPAPPTLQPQPSPRQQASRQQLPPPPPLRPPPPLSNPPMAKERLAHLPPPLLQERLDPPIVTLDDLFRKTKATPRIYYLPLSEEQVAAKLAEQAKNTKQ